VLRPDAHTAIRTDRRAGRVVGINTVTVSRDGKTWTGTVRGVTADNHAYSAATVWTRVK